jgi:nitrite reductase/ring-hydroxylating ferredoxin subunit
MKTVQLGEEYVLLVNSEGIYFGIGAICKHQEWDLSEGSLEGAKVTCAGHGAVWDLRTGQGEFDEPLANEPLYEVKVEGDYLLVRSA